MIDNGIGFTDENRQSFDTLYSDYKLKQGGKGFGRFICLKYFENLNIDSNYIECGTIKHRTFSMGKTADIIVNEKIANAQNNELKTVVTLENVKKPELLEKKLSTISRSLVEKLLPYFITEDYDCPKVILEEKDSTESIVLNEYTGRKDAVIKEIQQENNFFSLGQAQKKCDFKVRIFKIYSPRNKVSKISLVADKREVTETSTHQYIPEFSEEFYDKKEDGTEDRERNYIIKTYVLGEYLDKNVSLERGEFDFQKDDDCLYGISQSEIEEEAARITRNSISKDISTRIQKKQDRISSYVEQSAPWHKQTIHHVELTNFPYNPTDEEIESLLQKEKFKRELQIRREVEKILNNEQEKGFGEEISDLVERISESSKNDLIHYIALRRKVLDLLIQMVSILLRVSYMTSSSLEAKIVTVLNMKTIICGLLMRD